MVPSLVGTEQYVRVRLPTPVEPGAGRRTSGAEFGALRTVEDRHRRTVAHGLVVRRPHLGAQLLGGSRGAYCGRRRLPLPAATERAEQEIRAGLRPVLPDGFFQGRTTADRGEVAVAARTNDLLRAVALSPGASAELISRHLKELGT